ncbi:macro domain-containing protein [Maridesulfovibrio sp.]|uniref:macro domain-containing protein n=1 Tax=Maridesulfovibrio sp. TaxID=2795000 RepID=UPI002A18CC39|nr:macro domain-containing protein [Maridesulfovibrio sp.]
MRHPQPIPDEIQFLLDRLLGSCYISCLELAAQVRGVRSVAFCCISTGVFGFPSNRITTWLKKPSLRRGVEEQALRRFSLRRKGQSHRLYSRI